TPRPRAGITDPLAPMRGQPLCGSRRGRTSLLTATCEGVGQRPIKSGEEQQQGTDHGFVLDWLLSHSEVTAALGRRVVPGKSGRPRRKTERASADLVA
ncbi:MAG: hypothetical protein O6929_10155, partial [candidate division NC10 bacterium]|nr:hypothetical protein [candidate division NC10 bacterium]